MDKDNLRNQLYQAHSLDLWRLFPIETGLFYCPICLNRFSHHDIKTNALTDGHVWSETFVKNHTSSQKAFEQRVLLCYSCNSKSGARNEAALIEFEQFRQTRESGQYYRPTVTIQEIPGFKPVELGKLPIKLIGETDIQITFPVNKKTGHPIYNPNAREEFEKIIKRSSCSIIVQESFPHKEKWYYSQVSLLTSAYLMAFRTFGYRFVFQTCYDSIRSYILSSFEQNVDNRLEYSEEKLFSVRTCNTHHYDEPLLYIIPESAEKSQKIEVSFLDYHIVLPLPSDAPKIQESNPTDEYDSLINFTQHKPHEGRCSVDLIFHNPDYLSNLNDKAS